MRSPLLQPLLAFTTLVLLSCDQQPTQQTDTPVTTPHPDATAAPLDQSSKTPKFDPGDFVPVVNNRFFPLHPGTRFIFRGEADGVPERTIVDVTHQKKTILGIEATVVLDRVFQNGSLTEKTLDWYAQDEDGNVWYLGEDSKAYENGKVVSTAGSWEAGKNGAVGGVIMLAHPKVGDTYRQEVAAGVAEDMARVLHRGLSVKVPYGTFHGCLETEEFTPLEPGAKELKFHCPRTGFVKGRDVPSSIGHSELVRVVP
jgi:hypothetical protein